MGCDHQWGSPVWITGIDVGLLLEQLRDGGSIALVGGGMEAGIGGPFCL